MYTWDLFIGSINIAPYIVIVCGYLFTIFTSGYVVRYIISTRGIKKSDKEKDKPITEDKTNKKQREQRFDVGTIIGKCENFLVLTLIINSAYSALAIIFTAKSIVRMDEIKNNPKYYLGGTLTNCCYSILMAFLIRGILVHIGYSNLVY